MPADDLSIENETTAIGQAIECRSVTVRFQDRATREMRTVLSQLDMLAPGGSVVALLGKSGCGKSTLLRCVAGLQSIDSGSIAIGNKTIDEARRSLAFVFQEPALLPWRTALENVELPLEMQSDVGNFSIRDRSRRLLDFVGFAAADHNKLPTQLSGGMKMRVSLARALVTKPNLLLLDEPFAALDDMLRWRLNEMLLELHRWRSITILFVTHNIAEAIFLSHHIAIMKEGQIAEWIDNPLPQPRTVDLRSTVEFAKFYGCISKAMTS